MQTEPVLVVLDDDPTGTQTVHGVSVLTTWEPAEITGQFRRDEAIFYILTNSRSVSEPEAIALAQQIGAVLREASQQTGRPFVIISRSDSTLRGHFPAEVTAVAQAAAVADPLIILAPAFIEGGRLTEGNVHYVVENDKRTPVAETAFAKDPVFGYQHSNLTLWAMEKARNQLNETDVISLSIEELHSESTTTLSARIVQQKTANVLIINALTYEDLAKAADVVKRVRVLGRNIIIRSGASLVRVMAGIQPKPLLTGRAMKVAQSSTGGLVIVGSFVPKTTEQLQYLQTHLDLPMLEVSIQDARTDSAACAQSIRLEVERQLRTGKTVLVQSARQLVVGNSPEESLQIGQLVSSTLVQVVQQLTVIPAFIVAKGGITSSDIATKGMSIRRAIVQGQILPGIPVWKAEAGNRFSTIPYIVFPGNVGDKTALYEVISQLI